MCIIQHDPSFESRTPFQRPISHRFWSHSNSPNRHESICLLPPGGLDRLLHVALAVEVPLVCLVAIPAEVALAELGLQEPLGPLQLQLEPPHWADGSQNGAGHDEQPKGCKGRCRQHWASRPSLVLGSFLLFFLTTRKYCSTVDYPRWSVEPEEARKWV